MIDMHIHSNYSDGADSISEILEKCHNLGIDVISITDHNSVKSYKYEHFDDDIIVIIGCEFYAKKENVHGFHMLGYGFDLTNPCMQELLDELDRERIEYFSKEVEFIEKKYGIVIPSEAQKSFWHSNKEIYNYLIKTHSDEETRIIINSFSETGYKRHRKVDYVRLINVIKNSGGISVLAHPGEVKCDDFEEFIKELKENGLDGIEVYSSKHTKEQIEYFLDVAKRFDLLISCGSDYHGYNSRYPELRKRKLGVCNDGKFITDVTDISVYAYLMEGQKNENDN